MAPTDARNDAPHDAGDDAQGCAAIGGPGSKNPVLDRSGTIVGLSDKPQPRPLEPVDHARLFMDWLQHLDGFAGQRVVVSVLKRLYEGFCKETNLRAFSWRRVATEIRSLTGDKKRYGRVVSGNGTRRERIYRIPKAGASLEPRTPRDHREIHGDSADQPTRGPDGASMRAAPGTTVGRNAVHAIKVDKLNSKFGKSQYL